MPAATRSGRRTGLWRRVCNRWCEEWRKRGSSGARGGGAYGGVPLANGLPGSAAACAFLVFNDLVFDDRVFDHRVFTVLVDAGIHLGFGRRGNDRTGRRVGSRLSAYRPGHPKTVAAPHRTAQPALQFAAAVTGDADSDDDSAVLGEGFVRLPNAPRIEPNEDYASYGGIAGFRHHCHGISLSEDRATRKRSGGRRSGLRRHTAAVRLVSEGGTYEERPMARIPAECRLVSAAPRFIGERKWKSAVTSPASDLLRTPCDFGPAEEMA